MKMLKSSTAMHCIAALLVDDSNPQERPRLMDWSTHRKLNSHPSFTPGSATGSRNDVAEPHRNTINIVEPIVETIWIVLLNIWHYRSGHDGVMSSRNKFCEE